ncbi:MAG: beta-ketoacyl-[acyl-carrier-protein] synthase family protein [Victivallaceae bacterium]|nr:beta-ketoacyl-[acyl-carrier-protein] synthase family protein [Victivallaceae bacterium]
MEKKRVVVTGAGVVSALGNRRDELFDSLAAGKSAARYMPEWQSFFGKINIAAAPVTLDQEAVKKIDRRFRRSMGNAALFAALAAKQGVAESGLDEATLSNGRTGCVISSTMGSSSSIVESTAAIIEKRFDDLSACQFFRCVSHSSSFNVANLFGISGVQLAPCSACASALQSIGLAFEQIQSGKQDVIIAGGSDEATPTVAGSFQQLFALAENENLPAEKLSRPFDAARCGLVCGEGAGILILEEYEHALKRGAVILAELAGYATNCTGAQISQSDHVSIEQCIRLAVADAGINPADIDYVSAHATSTLAGDKEEAEAIRRVFGAAVPVSSLKGHLGHTLGASGAIELAAIFEMMKHDTIISTLNLENQADDCKGIFLPDKPCSKPLRTVVKNCIAFGGVNAVLVLRGYQRS